MELSQPEFGGVATLPPALASTSIPRDVQPADLFAKQIAQGWTLCEADDASVHLQAPSGAAYVTYTPDGEGEATEIGQPIVWSMGVCPPAPLRAANLPHHRGHAPYLIGGMVVQQPLWTIQLAGNVPADAALAIVATLADLIEDRHDETPPPQ